MNRTPLPDALARLLGQPSAEARLDSPPPPAPMALTEPASFRLGDLDDPLAALGTLLPEELPEAPFLLARAPDRPGLFVIEAQGPFTILRGQVRETRRALWVVDSRDGPTSLREGDWLLDLEQGRARAWRLDSGADASTWRLSEGEPSHGLVVPPWPGVAGLLGETGCAAWLRRRADELGSSPDPLDLLCAAGLLLRLWSPTTALERTRALESARAGTPWMLSPLRGWLGAEVDWAQVEQAAADRAEGLLGTLADLADLAVRDLPLARAAASRVVAGRDDLESLRVALAAMGGPRATLEDALVELDEAAVIHSLALSDLLIMEAGDPWLDAVAGSEPEAWWGDLVR